MHNNFQRYNIGCGWPLNHVCHLISTIHIIFDYYMKILQNPHLVVLSSFFKLPLGMKIMKWLLINVDGSFLVYWIVLIFINNLNQGVEFLIIHRVVQDSPMRHLKMITYQITSLYKDSSHSISTCIYLHFKRVLKVKKCKD